MDLDKCRENGKKSGKIQRARAEESYYANPNICKHCGQVIQLKEGVRPGLTRRQKFCSRSCAAKFNNTKFPKQRPQLISAPCERCGETVEFKKKRGGGYMYRRFCASCVVPAMLEARGRTAIENKTKGQIRSECKNYTDFNSRITTHARRIFRLSGKPYKCEKCGYSLHAEVCHVVDIKDFPDETLIERINCIENLVSLCRNCHWEFDHGHFTIEKIRGSLKHKKGSTNE